MQQQQGGKPVSQHLVKSVPTLVKSAPALVSQSVSPGQCESQPRCLLLLHTPQTSAPAPPWKPTRTGLNSRAITDSASASVSTLSCDSVWQQEWKARRRMLRPCVSHSP
jgi:hypothetical protein